MPAQINWFEADGVTQATRADWGFVAPGQTSATLTFIFRNTGDAPATNAQLTVQQVGAVDLENWIAGTYEGNPFTYAAPLDIGSVAVGAQGTVTLLVNIPPSAQLSSRPLLAQPAVAYDLTP